MHKRVGTCLPAYLGSSKQGRQLSCSGFLWSRLHVYFFLKDLICLCSIARKLSFHVCMRASVYVCASVDVCGVWACAYHVRAECCLSSSTILHNIHLRLNLELLLLR